MKNFHQAVEPVADRMTERALRRTNKNPISNLIGRRRNKQTTTLTFVYSGRLQRYILVSSFKAYCQTERPITTENSIRFCYNFSHTIIEQLHSISLMYFNFSALNSFVLKLVRLYNLSAVESHMFQNIGVNFPSFKVSNFKKMRVHPKNGNQPGLGKNVF